MMTKKFLYICFISLAFYSCEDTTGDGPIDEEVGLQDFLWKSMNSYYFWQEDVADLSDDKFEFQSELNDYLKNKTDIPSFFYDDLVNEYRVIDRFSWIVDDYIALEESFQGFNISNGVDFGLFVLNQDDSRVFGVVRYIMPISDAEGKDIVRGEIFNRVDGIELNRTNYQSLLFGNDNYTLGFVDYNDGDPIEIDKEISLSKERYSENPIFINKTFNLGDKKVGYLMYNSFTSRFDDQLNEAFGELKSQGVDELVLDLRYNGGGSVRTATYLAAMITGQFTGSLFSSENWNSKVMAYFNSLDETERDSFLNTYFPDEIESSQTAINSLNLSKVYVITTQSTASASELIINSLLPYIDVVVVGSQGTGKFVASTTLYDSDDFTKEGANLAEHTWAIQPIILEEFNAQGVNNGIQGFLPDIEQQETYGNMGVLGEIEEPLLRAALNSITPFQKKRDNTTRYINHKLIGESKESSPLYQKMITYKSLKK